MKAEQKNFQVELEKLAKKKAELQEFRETRQKLLDKEKEIKDNPKTGNIASRLDSISEVVKFWGE